MENVQAVEELDEVRGIAYEQKTNFGVLPIPIHLLSDRAGLLFSVAVGSLQTSSGRLTREVHGLESQVSHPGG